MLELVTAILCLLFRRTRIGKIGYFQNLQDKGLDFQVRRIKRATAFSALRNGLIFDPKEPEFQSSFFLKPQKMFRWRA